MDTDTHRKHFLIHVRHFVRTYTRNWKTTGRMWTLYIHIDRLIYYRRCLFTVLELGARYEGRITSPNTHRTFSAKPFVRIQLYLIRICGSSAYHIRTFSQLNDCDIIGCILCVVYSCMRDRLERYGPRHALFVLWYNIVCVYYTMLTYTTAPNNKTHKPYDCILHTKRRLYCQRSIIL